MRLRRRQFGGTLLEAALALPILFVLLFGILEFGRAFNLYQTLTDAAREGARYSVAPYYNTFDLPTTAEVEARVHIFLDAAHVKDPIVAVNQTQAGTVNGEDLVFTSVEVTAPYKFVYFPFGTINIKSKAVMRNETN